MKPRSLLLPFLLSSLVSLVGCDSSPDDTSADAAPSSPDADPAAPDASNAQCDVDNDMCTGETICISGQCEAAFGRTYRIEMAALVLPTLNQDAMPWDVSGGAPDPYFVVTINGAEVLRSLPSDDTFIPGSDATTLEVIPAGAEIVVEVYDEDIGTDDFMMECAARPITPAQLRSGFLSCSEGSITDAPTLMLFLGRDGSM